MQGGIHPSFTGEDYLEILRAAKRGAPEMHVHAFSPLEVTHGAKTLGLSISDYLVALKAEGLGSLPGTAAEVLHDDVRAKICPDKLTSEEWLRVVSTAHAVGIPTTSTMMFGHVDADGPDAWARHLLELRRVHVSSASRSHRKRESDSMDTDTAAASRRHTSVATSANHPATFTEFVPLPFVHFEAPAFRAGDARRGPTLRECILVHAVARLTLGPRGREERSGVLGEDGPGNGVAAARVRVQRPRGHADEREHHARRRRRPRAGVRASGAFYTNVFHPSPGFNT